MTPQDISGIFLLAIGAILFGIPIGIFIEKGSVILKRWLLKKMGGR